MVVPRTGRICIVGGGAAGVAAALELGRRGYTKVTILERSPEGVGGKCRSIVRDGIAMETGAVYVLPNYPAVTRYAAASGVQLRPAEHLVHLERDGSSRPFGVPPHRISTFAKAAEYLRLGAELFRHRHVWRAPLGELSDAHTRTLAQPLSEWIDCHRLAYFRAVAYPLLRCFGFGFEEQRVPLAYILKVLPQTARGGNLLSLWNVGGIALQQVDEGYGEMWRRLAAALDVRAGVTISRVSRGERGGEIETDAGTIGFDALILACPLDRALDFLDADPEERDVFGRIRSFDVWQAVARIEGLPAAAILEANQGFAALGRALVAFRYREGAPWYYVFGYDAPGWDDAAIARALDEDVRAHGGRVVDAPVVRRWPGYFPHFSSEDFAGGCLARIEQLQGVRSTFYAGEVVSNIGVESTATYAERLIAQHFP
jgi:Flavin containing amine oxidoreductase